MWYFTSRMRAVESARSMCVPRRANSYASSRCMVPKVTPRKRWLRSFTQSKNADTPRDSIFSSFICCIASHVELSTSHISEVMEPRTERAFSQLLRAGVSDEGFSGSSAMKRGPGARTRRRGGENGKSVPVMFSGATTWSCAAAPSPGAACPRDVEDARGALAPDVARHPVEARGDAREHQSTTHVSFTPPPCEEFTTSDPSRNATRVRPPGTMFTSEPVST